jgi:hypothetical protein
MRARRSMTRRPRHTSNTWRTLCARLQETRAHSGHFLEMDEGSPGCSVTDSLLEEGGFEPSVPRAKESAFLAERNSMREIVHLGATRDQKPRCYLRVRGGRRIVNAARRWRVGIYVRPNICNLVAH